MKQTVDLIKKSYKLRSSMLPIIDMPLRHAINHIMSMATCRICRNVSLIVSIDM